MVDTGTDPQAAGCCWGKGGFMLQNHRQLDSPLERDQAKRSVKFPTYGHRFAMAGLVILLLAGLISIT
jgi:hypothetical protein